MLFTPTEKGQGLVEYALILVLVFVVVVAALYYLVWPLALKYIIPAIKHAWQNA